MEKITIEKLAEMSAREFGTIGKRLDGIESKLEGGFKAVLDALEHIDGGIAEVKRSTVSALDYIRLEKRVDLLEEELGKMQEAVK